MVYKGKHLAEQLSILRKLTICGLQNVAKKILKRENCGETQNREIMSFFRDSWVQIPDQTSSSRLMRPRYVERQRTTDRKGGTDGNGSEIGKEEANSAVSTATPSTASLGDAEDESANDQSSSNSNTEQGSTSKDSTKATEEPDLKFLGASALYVSNQETQFCRVLIKRSRCRTWNFPSIIVMKITYVQKNILRTRLSGLSIPQRIKSWVTCKSATRF